MDLHDRAVLTAMQSAIERAVLVELARAESLAFTELVERLDESKSNVGFHLKFLVSGGLVKVEASGLRIRYRSTRPDLVLRLYATFRESFEEKWADRFIETWSGLFRD